ncbi:MAG: hypothetical protein AAGA87_11060 [Pseudomonadota bacterium]
MTDRFADLKKIPDEPAARVLARENTELSVKLDSPASAPVPAVLQELEDKGATLDMIRLLSVALPARERVWWACLAAKELSEKTDVPPTPTLAAAEAWVFEPTEANQERARTAIQTAGVNDDFVHCATGVLYATDTLGPGELKEYPAPPGVGAVSAFTMNILALRAHGEDMERYQQRIIDRALDIARGGNGRLTPKGAAEEGE